MIISKQCVEEQPEEMVDISRMCNTITNIAVNCSAADTAEHYREIAALIYHHSLLHGKGETKVSKNKVKLVCPLPYNPRVVGAGKGALYEMSKLPLQLQLIISKYLRNYSK